MYKAFARRTRALVLVFGITAAGIGAMPAAEASALTANQCVVTVSGTDASGNFIVSPMKCYTTYAAVLASTSVGSAIKSFATPATESPSALQDDAILATHYDGSSWTGASFSVSGSICSGGGLNLPLSWNDRISSTANGCNDIIHYKDTNYGGNTYVTTGVGGNLGNGLDNNTSSIKYYA